MSAHTATIGKPSLAVYLYAAHRGGPYLFPVLPHHTSDVDRTHGFGSDHTPRHLLHDDGAVSLLPISQAYVVFPAAPAFGSLFPFIAPAWDVL